MVDAPTVRIMVVEEFLTGRLVTSLRDTTQERSKLDHAGSSPALRTMGVVLWEHGTGRRYDEARAPSRGSNPQLPLLGRSVMIATVGLGNTPQGDSCSNQGVPII